MPVLAVPLLVFAPLLALGILSITPFAAADGQELELAQVGIFVVVSATGTALAWRALDSRPRAMPRAAADA